ncbi:MAG TPA: FAD-dependent oxidoreductase [Nocardioides sp.]|uniref:NAD(P)/FAD-dependent oxidoreductase n=1 Tax=Nocardioides sp. TaxID=35761 RepID=UPI002E368FD3|nr:FAD-dependent oxidoreductase [Nocardioides sp.]HEX5088961.1 FAD-dependent oxidoreductase [Nocardioides sp.]
MTRPHVLVVGCGFGGFHAVRRLESRLSLDEADITVVTPRDHLLYTPLLPEVAGGLLDPRAVTVPLTGRLRSRLVLGNVDDLDLPGRRAWVTDPEGSRSVLAWDRLVLAAGSVSSPVTIPGLTEHAVGFKTTAEAAFLRDHVLQQLELAMATDDPQVRAERTTFVVIGAGFAGTELVAFLHRLTQAFARHHRSDPPLRPRWVLVDATSRVLPELGRDLGGRALAVLRRRGVDVRLRTTVAEVAQAGVRTSDGRWIPSRTVVWCGGVTPNPLVHRLGLPLERGRVRVDERLAVAGAPGVFALGDLAAVADLTRPGHDTAQTAQHAMRQGRTVADAVLESLGRGTARPYRHHDLGLAADLGGWQAVARPLGLPLTGPAARVAARGYHLAAIPGNRSRIAASWLTGAGRPPLLVHLDLNQRPHHSPLMGSAS